jgi:PAS domain S-box-containing protein
MHVSCPGVSATRGYWIEADAMSGTTDAMSDSEFEAALSSTELFRQLLESAPDAIVGIGRDGRIAFVNAQTEALFGYARDELIGDRVEKLVPERYHRAHGGHRSGYFTDPRTRPMGAGLDLYGLRSDGSEFPAEISLSSIETEDGLLATAAIRDITDRKNAEAKFQQLLESAPDAIVGIGRDGRIVLVNAQTEALFGYARDELIDERVEKLVPKRYHNAHGQHRSGYFTDPRTRPMGAGLNLFGVRRDGSEFPAEISLSSIETEDGLLATAAIRDITDRKNAERDLARHAAELQRSNVELSQYAYVASHDLQEPLRMVVTYTDKLGEHLDGTLEPRAQEWAGYIVEGATRMQSLIEGLLEFSRVRPEEAEFVDIDCEVVLRRALANLQAAVLESAATITHDPLPTICADAVQQLQLFQNLIGNALKFRGDEAPVIHLGCDRDGSNWHFSVCDNGIGIDAGDADQIFVLFRRLHSKDAYAGAGIGLALCKKIVDAHHGRLWVQSEPGAGAKFHWLMPAERPVAA